MTINSNETAVTFKSHFGHPVSAGKQWASNNKNRTKYDFIRLFETTVH